MDVRTYAGQNGPILVLHGGPGAPGSVTGLASALAPEFEVWEPLQRRSGDVELTVDRHVADLRAVAPDAATIVGHSWGRCSGCRTRRAIPRRCALALVGCGTYDEASRAEYERRINGNLGTEGLRRKRRLRAAIERTRDAAERDRLFAARGPPPRAHDPRPPAHLLTCIPQLEYMEFARCAHGCEQRRAGAGLGAGEPGPPVTVIPPRY